MIRFVGDVGEDGRDDLVSVKEDVCLLGSCEEKLVHQVQGSEFGEVIH